MSDAATLEGTMSHAATLARYQLRPGAHMTGGPRISAGLLCWWS